MIELTIFSDCKITIFDTKSITIMDISWQKELDKNTLVFDGHNKSGWSVKEKYEEVKKMIADAKILENLTFAPDQV